MTARWPLYSYYSSYTYKNYSTHRAHIYPILSPSSCNSLLHNNSFKINRERSGKKIPPVNVFFPPYRVLAGVSIIFRVHENYRAMHPPIVHIYSLPDVCNVYFSITSQQSNTRVNNHSIIPNAKGRLVYRFSIHECAIIQLYILFPYIHIMCTMCTLPATANMHFDRTEKPSPYTKGNLVFFIFLAKSPFFRLSTSLRRPQYTESYQKFIGSFVRLERTRN